RSAGRRRRACGEAGWPPGPDERGGLRFAWVLRSPRSASPGKYSNRRFRWPLHRVRCARRIGSVVPEYVALDLETTGLDPARDRVIEVGAVAFTPELVSASLERLVNPGRAVPEAVLRLTGIRQEELRGAATPEE